MGHIGNRLQRDLGPVEGATARRGAGRELLGAALLAGFLSLFWLCSQAGSSNTDWIFADTRASIGISRKRVGMPFLCRFRASTADDLKNLCTTVS
jgi:hypothetical protein